MFASVRRKRGRTKEPATPPDATPQLPKHDWLFMLWLLVQPVENGGYGMRWSDAIRLGPTQALFIMQTKEQAEAAATQRNRKLNGLDVQEHADLQRARMKELRKRYTGVDSRQELSEKKPAKKR